MRLYFVLIVLLITSPNQVFAEAVRSLSMQPGDSMTVEYPAGSTVKVSRKGIIDVFSISETAWQLTALRGGMVIIDAFDASGHAHLPRLFVDVKSKSEASRPAVSLGLPQWICKHRGVSCPEESGLVRGTTNDYQWFLRAKSWCGTSNNCALHVKLSSTAQNELSTFLSEILPAYQIQVIAHGRIIIKAPCDGITFEQHSRTIDSLFPRAIEDRMITFSCSGDQDAYRISVRVKKVSSSEGKTIGYDGHFQHEISSPPTASHVAAHASLKAEAMKTTSETIGEPSFIATGSKEFQTLIGGELPYMTHTETQGKSYQWKEYGLSIKGLLQGTITKRAQVRGAFEIFLKTINSNDSGGLHSSSLKSNMIIPLKAWTNLGELDLNSEVDEKRSIPFASHIPIIGPLFRTISAAQSQSKLQIWAYIELQEGLNQ